ncbi:MAG TPA: dockerin type I repeat-containing protein [Tepidisphaeraceae bacterium]
MGVQVISLPRSRFIFAACVVLASTLRADVLFYGGDPGGNANNPVFTLNSLNQKDFGSADVYQYDDFTVPAGEQWSVTGLFANVLFNNIDHGQLNDPNVTTSASYEIRQGLSPGSSGVLLDAGTVPDTLTYVSDGIYGYYEYQLAATPSPTIVLGPGTYWLSLAPISASPGNNLADVYQTFGSNGIGSPLADQLSYETGDDIQFNLIARDFSMGVSGATAPITGGSSWAIANSGDWNNASNWNDIVPDGVGSEADFFGMISSAQTVYTNIPITVGTIHFNSAITYVLAGAGTIMLQAASGSSALVQVDQGTQEFELPVTIASDTTFNVAGGATLLVANTLTIDAGDSVTQTGSGTVTYQSIVTLETGASLSIGNTTTGNTLSLGTAAKVFVAPNTGTPTTIQFNNLSLAAGASIDVANNLLVVNYSGGADPVALVANYLATGYKGGAWNGAGINSTIAAANATGSTTLGYFDTGTQVEIKYTWLGDANLDGVVDASDLADMSVSGTSWQTGDFNYDGKVNGDDYALFMLGDAASNGNNISTTLPEPAAGAFVAVLALILHRRRGLR